MASPTLKTLRDIALLGRDLGYIARTVVVLKQHIVGPAADVLSEWLESTKEGKQNLSNDQTESLREKIDSMDDGQDKEDLKALLSSSQ